MTVSPLPARPVSAPSGGAPGTAAATRTPQPGGFADLIAGLLSPGGSATVGGVRTAPQDVEPDGAPPEDAAGEAPTGPHGHPDHSGAPLGTLHPQAGGAPPVDAVEPVEPEPAEDEPAVPTDDAAPALTALDVALVVPPVVVRPPTTATVADLTVATGPRGEATTTGQATVAVADQPVSALSPGSPGGPSQAADPTTSTGPTSAMRAAPDGPVLSGPLGTGLRTGTAPTPQAPALPPDPAGATSVGSPTTATGSPTAGSVVAARHAVGWARPTETAAAPGSPAPQDSTPAPTLGTVTAPTSPAAVTGPAAADVPTPQGVARQVAAEVLRLAESGPRHDTTKHVTLQLNPAALGEVRVTLSMRGGTVRVRLSAGSGVTREALAAGVPELRRLLGDHVAEPAGLGRGGRPGPSEVAIVVADLPRDPASGSDATTDHHGEPRHSDTHGSGRDGSRHDQHQGGAAFGAPGHHDPRPARTPVGPTATDGSRPAAHPPSVDDQPPSSSPRRLDVSV